MGELGGLSYYLAAGKADEKDRAIVLYVLRFSHETCFDVLSHACPLRSGTDIFGLGLVNCKILADWFADKTGFPVFVPDYFEGARRSPSSGKTALTFAVVRRLHRHLVNQATTRRSRRANED